MQANTHVAELKNLSFPQLKNASSIATVANGRRCFPMKFMWLIHTVALVVLFIAIDFEQLSNVEYR